LSSLFLSACNSDTAEVSEGEESRRVASAGLVWEKYFEDTEEGDGLRGLFPGGRTIDIQPQST
jgi:hypothetical protein